MRKFAIAAAAAATAIAVPAQAQDSAGEGRIEARGGIVWAGGAEEAVAGVAAGYDFDLADEGGIFLGVEASADHILASGADFVWGVGGRFGFKAGDNGKLYAAGGYAFGDGEDVPYLGAGYSHKVGEKVYISGEYRHFFSDFIDVNAVTLGVGVNF